MPTNELSAAVLPAVRKMSLVMLRVLQVMPRMLPRCWGVFFSLPAVQKMSLVRLSVMLEKRDDDSDEMIMVMV